MGKNSFYRPHHAGSNNLAARMINFKFSIPNFMTYINLKSNFEVPWVKKWLKKFVGAAVIELWVILGFFGHSQTFGLSSK